MSITRAAFVDGPQGSLFLTLVTPDAGASGHWYLHAPAFLEEMNKSRHLVLQQARALADHGYSVLIPDLSGTGDSPAGLTEATIDGWLEELHWLVTWLRDNGAHNVNLWGLRFGCLLATIVAGRDRQIGELLLWQPVASGRQQLTQLLRIRAAGQLGAGQGETVAALRAQLAAGTTLEVAGYPISPVLADGIESLDLAAVPLPAGCDIRVIELAAESGKDPLPVTRKILATWQAQGIAAAATVVVGPPFWMTQELAFAPALIAQTLSGSERVKAAPQALPPTTDGPWTSLAAGCEGASLSLLCHPGSEATGVLVVVGGPQYRVGSHRQFLHLASALSEAGYPVCRFDYRGMGDSEGEYRGFEHVQADIDAALLAFRKTSGVRRVVLWGLCDGATAALRFAATHNDVAALVLANPWVHSPAGEARAYLKHYYLKRLISRDFWRKVFSGRWDARASLREGGGAAGRALAGDGSGEGLAGNVAGDLEQFRGEVLLILSANDLVAAEFRDAAARLPALGARLSMRRVQLAHLPGVDHTFSRQAWREQVAALTLALLRRLDTGAAAGVQSTLEPPPQ